nr:glycine zipper family protein [Gordonia insulae]
MFTFRRTGSTRRSSALQLRVLAIISLAIAAITAFAGSVQAAPAQAGPVTYDVSKTADSMSLTVHNGTISTGNGMLVIRNNAGAEKFRMPLNYRMEYRQFPIDARTAGKTATLVPSRDVSRSTVLDPAQVEPVRAAAAAKQSDAPRTKRERDDQALARFNQELSAGMSISSIVGTLLGALVGAVAGCLLGLPLAGLGCLPGIPLGASLGGLAGIALGGGGSLIYSAINYFNTINSPFVPPRR